MLGYPTHFGQMECLKLIASHKFPEKRIGYLGLMLLLDEETEVLMLVTNSLKNDLNHANQFIVGQALCALGDIGSPDMCRDLASEVEKLLASNNQYIRKKACLALLRIVRKCPDFLEHYLERIPTLLSDRSHGVLVGTLALMIEIGEASPAVVVHLRRHTQQLVRMLKNLVLSGYAPEHDVSGLTDPFLQAPPPATTLTRPPTQPFTPPPHPPTPPPHFPSRQARCIRERTLTPAPRHAAAALSRVYGSTCALSRAHSRRRACCCASPLRRSAATPTARPPRLSRFHPPLTRAPPAGEDPADAAYAGGGGPRGHRRHVRHPRPGADPARPGPARPIRLGPAAAGAAHVWSRVRCRPRVGRPVVHMRPGGSARRRGGAPAPAREAFAPLWVRGGCVRRCVGASVRLRACVRVRSCARACMRRARVCVYVRASVHAGVDVCA